MILEIVDVFLFVKQGDLTEILVNYSICPVIQFTIENETDYKRPFLDILIKRKENVTGQEILIPVYRKTSFSGQHLNFKSKNHASHKIVVARTSAQRERKYCSNDEVRQLEKKILYDLKYNGYPNTVAKMNFFR